MTKIRYSFSTVYFKTNKKIINETNYANNEYKNIRTDIKVLIFEELKDKFAIISADLIWFSDDLSKKIKFEIENIFNINKKNIFLCATHTHGSLQTDPNFKFGDYNESFNNLIISKVVKTVNDAILKEQITCLVKYGEADIDPISVSRRLYSLTLTANEPFKRVQNRPNISNKYPSKIKTISFYAKNKNPELVLLNFPCHPLLDNVGISGRDYPGYINDEIENIFNNKTKLIFLQGFCGDISPRFIFKPKNIKDNVLEKLIGPKFKKPDSEQKKYFVNSFKKSIITSIKSSKEIYLEKIESNTFNINLTNNKNNQVNRNLKVSYLKLTNKLGFVFANAEMLFNFDYKYNDDIISVGYTNGMVGYIAPKNEYKYKGYEINGFLERFNLKNEFNQNTELKFDITRDYLLSKHKDLDYYKKIWSLKNYKNWKISYAPKNYNFKDIEKLLDLIEFQSSDEIISDFLNSFKGNFSIIAKKNNTQFACVDSIRAFPIFYSKKQSKFTYNPRAILNNLEYDQKGITELSMSSYVLGDRTLFKDIKQLRPGEIVYFPKFKKKQYFKFYPKKIYKKNIDQLSEELNLITNKIIKRVIEKYKNKRILVPLSGGLDSRLVLSKLVEFGCQNLEAITYGIDNNGELKIAREVAKKLNVKWNFVPTSDLESKKIFNSEVRKNYWKSSSGNCVLPNMQEFHLFYNLKKNKTLNNYDVVINGQAGDFITGGHINTKLNNKINKNEFLELIINKHFNLWSHLNNKKNINLIKDEILENLNFYLNTENKSSFDAYDAQLWEWSERQSKFVSNQQRVYEFFDLDWYLPLWDREYIDFWINCPSELLVNQKLYKYYLEKWNYKNLFTDKKLKRAINPWIGNKKIFIIFANIIKLFLNDKYKEEFYKYVKYYNHYSNHYHSYKLRYFLKRAKFIRNHTSLNVETYITENVPDNDIFV